MKAEELIRDALQELGQQAAEQPVQADEMQTGIRYLNRLMRGVDYLGLGFTVITSGSQEVSIPAYAEEWAVFKLAIRMASQFPPTDQIQIISANERQAWSNLLIQHLEIPQMRFDDRMPIGSGNEDGVYSDRFYPTNGSSILTEGGDHILLEDA
jgi:hypothetical protein